MIIASSMVFLGLMLLGLVSDMRTQRIPKWITVPGVVLGLTAGALAGWAGLGAAFAGAVLGMLVGTVLFALGALGGGDVKLLAVVGAFLGPMGLGYALLAGGAIGGILGLWIAIRRGVILPTLLNTRDLGMNLLTLGRRGDRMTLDSAAAIRVPYGVAIALGGLIARFVVMPGLLT
jgi:prepilin peptidase CpaA